MIIKKAMPEPGERVLVRIKKVMPFGAYCELVEYGIDSYLPIKEVASGWIKNIHEFIKEGGRDVAEVIFVDKEKKAVDISLKKVNSKGRKDKLNQFALEGRGEKMFGQAVAAANLKGSEDKLKAELAIKFETYADLVDAVVANAPSIAELKVDKKFLDAFKEIISKSIKPRVFKVSYTAELISQNSRFNIGEVKKLFGEMEGLGIKVTYLGAPHYLLVSVDSSYPKAEDRIKQAESLFEKYSKADSFEFSLKKEKAQ